MERISLSILGPACQRVINIALEEYRLVSGVKEEIKNLCTTVKMIKEVLEDAERKQAEDGKVRTWLISLKQVLFDAEDIFDEIATDEALGRDAEDGTLLSKVRFELISIFTRCAIAHRVKDINNKFVGISKLIDTFGLHVSNGTSGSVFRRPRPETSSLLPSCEAHIIGRDGEMQKIEELLLEYSAEETLVATNDNYKNVHVISVFGMGGLGKTTLVKHAYNSPAVAEYFQLRMWVCVSNYFDVKRITKEIIDAAASSSNERRDEFVGTSNWDVVQNRLKGKLEEKRFLLVLDDVWEENSEEWNNLCAPLMYGGKGSKIIVTTRSHTVANNIAKGTPIFLNDLPSEDLWTILQNNAFDGHDPVKYPLLVFKGKQIVDKLKGSPLVARTIGRVLNENLDVSHWTNILSSKAWESLDSEYDILPILKLSYDHLPGHLKQCFAYCSMFPEDHEFDKDELVQLWMAQRYIMREDFFYVESEGGVYLDKLVHMSLFGKKKNTIVFGQEIFVMHDLIHNLADLVSKDDCLRLEDKQQNGIISDTIRHVSIASDRFDLPKIKQLCNKYENMRTLLFLRGCKFQLDPHLDNIFKKLQRLRVLRLSRCGIKELPPSIGTLKHLQFLDLSKNGIIKLPESLCNLHNLQVLNLEYCGWIRALPRNMSSLINLRHLKTTNDELVCGIQGLGKLTALHELTFDCGMQPMKELADMGMLRRLRIWGLREVKSREVAAGSRLDKKEHLDELELGWRKLKGRWINDDDDDVNHPGLEEEVLDSLQPPHSSIRRLTICNYGGSRSPSWMEEDQSWLRDSRFLETLDLKLCKNWEVLPPLGLLLCLHSLKIERMRRVRRIGPAFMGCCRQLPRGGFPSLQVLQFSYMDEWEEWEVPLRGTDADDGGEDDQVFLARLRELRIDNCPKLRQLPPLPPTLTKLYIRKVGLTHFPGWRLQPSSSSSSSVYSLCSLEISSCPNLEGDDDGEDDQVFSEAPPPPPPQQHHRRRPLFLAPLRELRIWDCPKLRQLPPLPPTLTKLHIEHVGLTHLPGWRLPPSSSLPCCCPSSSSVYSLCSLEIFSCPNLEGDDDGEDDQVFSEALPPPPQQHHRRRPLFLARLRELTFWNCPKLRQLPPLPPTLTKLYMENVGLTHLPEWWLPPSSSCSCCSSPSLSSLQIRDCPELTSLADGLLRHSLPNLVKLEIINCEGLVSLPADTAFGHLTSLKELEVERCPKLAWASTCESPSVEDSGLPPSLESITIQGDCGEVMDQMMLAIVSSGQKLACLRKLHVLGPRMWRSRGTYSNMEISSTWHRRPVSIETCPAVTPPPTPTLRRSLPSSLQKLTICDIDQLDDETLSAWLRGLTSLRELSIEDCPAVTSLPRAEVLSHLTALEQLEINRLKALSSFGGGIHCLVSLERLTITEGCFSRPPPTTLRRSLPSSLQQLAICDIDQLDDETLSAWLRDLTSLRELYMYDCPAVTSLPRAEVLSHLTSLKKLEITSLKALSSFGGGIHCLVSLEELIIVDCPELLDIITTTAADSSRPSSSSALPSPARSVGTSTTRIRKLEISGSSMQQIKTWLLQCPSLQDLHISECPQLTGFGGNNDGGDDVGDQLEAALLNLSGTLQRLELSGCHNLRSLPPRLRCLSSLQSLRITNCPQIRSLPVAGLPESLRDLGICRCPALEERCKEGVGSDWPLISHIPEDRRSISLW